jgi:hypothetical protein
MQGQPTFDEARKRLDDVLAAIDGLDSAPNLEPFAEVIGRAVDDDLLEAVEEAVSVLGAVAAIAHKCRSEVVFRADAPGDPALFGPFVVQSRLEGDPWQTMAVFDRRADADREAGLWQGTHMETALVKGALSPSGELRVEPIDRGDLPIGGPAQARVVSLVELLLEPREELYRAIRALLTSDHERRLRLGGDLGRTAAFMAAAHARLPTNDAVAGLIDRLELEAARHGVDALALVGFGLDLAESMPPITVVRDVVDEVRSRLAGQEHGGATE